MNKRDAIQKFLSNQVYDLGKLYTPSMEVQVNVAQDEGKIISGLYKGKRWQGYTDGLTTWKHFRIPWMSGEYEDSEIKFDISEHTEAIGMTGWDWIHKTSRWVGFDFDSIIGHKKGLTSDQIEGIKNALINIHFVSIYTSTSGLGLHVYVFLSCPDLIVNDRLEHAAVARAILDKISALSGVSFQTKVDILGGNMWVWHRKADDTSYQCIQEGDTLTKIPPNWKDYLDRVNKYKLTPKQKTDKSILIASHKKIDLAEEHSQVIKWFENSNFLWWWDDERSMLVCHTSALKQAHLELGLKGFFETTATGKENPDQNCFCFPIQNGAWIIRRHNKGTTEHESWFIDHSGWTSCYFNRVPTLQLAARNIGAVETEKDYTFNSLSDAYRALLVMGIEDEIPKEYRLRPAILRQSRDGRLILEFELNKHDPNIPGFAKKKDVWQKIYYKPHVIDEIELPDNLLRHVIINQSKEGWYLNTNNSWVNEDKSEIVHVLSSLGNKKPDIDNMLGMCVLNNWNLVHKPFQSEYPGNREWNKNAAQFRFNPEEGYHPTWDLILNHLGKNLTESLVENPWFINQGITEGRFYLLSWISLLFQEPNQPLPYLFLYGPQNSGKSILHEALSLLVTTGFIRADHALTNMNGFNGELYNAVLCIVEETNLSKKGPAADRIKDWVTGQRISIRALFKNTIDAPNYTHWIQCANDAQYCPILPGDTRITVVRVNSLTTVIPKPLLLQKLEHEAPAFLYTCINFETYKSPDRLRLPVIETTDKQEQMELNKSPLQEFCDLYVKEEMGNRILFSDFYDSFINWLEPQYHSEWTKRKISANIPIKKERIGGNIWLLNVIINVP